MNNWSQENYAMQNKMHMNMLPNAPLLPLPLPTPMYTMQDVPPMNPPPPLPMQLLNQPSLSDIANPDNANECVVKETSNPDVSSRNNEMKRRSRERSNSQRRDRERGRRSRSRDSSRYDYRDRQDRTRSRHQRERRSKWDDGKKEIVEPIMPPEMNMHSSMMMHTGMGPYQNMMANTMIAPNMMQNMRNNMMMQQPIEQNQIPSMMAQMNMMNNMMPNMMDQNIMINQQMMPIIANQPMYISSGVIMPPEPEAQIPIHKEKPKGCRTILVSGLPKRITVDAVTEIFQRFGTIHDIKSPKSGVFYVRFQRPESVEQSLSMSGFRYKVHDQMENEATTILVDYAFNRDDQNEYEKQQRQREPTPPRVEPFSTAALSNLSDKIKNEEDFPNLAPTLAAWLSRGECSKKNANTFYSLVQVSNNQSRRLFNEKMQLDDEFLTLKSGFRDKFAHVLGQLEQVAKILNAAKHQRVSDHFTKQQRRNIDMWLKMTEEVENFKEEFQTIFDEEETEKTGKNTVSLEKYEELKMENESLSYELEGYKNEALVAKDEADIKFEKFKAHFIAQQALLNKPQAFPPLPRPLTPKPPPPSIESRPSSTPVPPSEAKLISILTAFLMVHPLGVSIDYLTSYVKSMTHNVSQADVQTILQKYEDVFQCKVTGVGASIDHKWTFAAFDNIKSLQ